MPPGSFEMSLRSSASSAAAEILVLAAICRSEIPRRSRAWRSFPPKSSMSAATLDNLGKTCQTHEQFDRRVSRGAGAGDRLQPRSIDAPDRDDRERRARARRAEDVESGDGMSRRFACGGKDGAEQQIVARPVRERG